MKNKATALFNWVKKHYVWSIVILVALLFIASKVFGGSSNSDQETIVLTPQEFVRTVSVSGKITPADDVELGFESSGRVTAVYKKEGEKVYAGETLAVLSSGDVSADVLQAQADLAAEQAKLDELNKGTSNGNSLDNTKDELKEAVFDAYTRSDNAIRNNVDQFYDGNEIVFAFDDYDLKKELDRSRRDIEYMLDTWKTNLTLEASEKNLATIKNFLGRVALAVNDFQIEGSAYSQTEIDKFKSDVSAARTSINTAITNLISAKDSVRDIQSEIPYQEARVQSALAVLKSRQSELSKRAITAPFTGVVTKIDAKVGEIVSANTVMMRLISDAAFTIETYVPEINISEVAIGNMAQVTLDAYGDDVFFVTRIASIDSAETIRDGVSTYKVVFEFTTNDERLKSGMTANVVITTETKQDTLLIPQESIIKRNGFSYVKVKVGKEEVEKQVTTGSVASNGYLEVVSGLSSGEVLIKNAN